MPITLVTRSITSSDPFAKPPVARTPSDNAVLSETILLPLGSLALLHPNSSKTGIAVDVTDFPIPVLILFCDATKRSCIIAVDEARLLSQGHDAQLSYIAQGASRPVINASFLYFGSLTPPNRKILGYALRASAKRTSVQVKVNILIPPVQASAIFLARGTGAVEALLPSPEARFNTEKWPEPEAVASFLMMWQGLNFFQHGCYFGDSADFAPIPCLYDGETYPERLPVLSSEALDVLAVVKREMAAVVKNGKDPAFGWWQDALAASLGIGALDGQEDAIRRLLLPVRLFSPACIVCAKERVSLRGSGCGMEYCSSEHQRENWPHHKEW